MSYKMKLLDELEVLDYLIEEKGMTKYMKYFYDKLEELLKINPQDEDILISASRFHAYGINDSDRAIALAERAMKLYPNARTIINYFELLTIKEFCD